MALLYIDGFDAGDYLIKGWSGSTLSTSTTTRYGSGRSLMVGGSNFISRTIPATTNIFMGIAVYYTGQDYNPYCFNLQGDNATANHLNVKWTNATTLALQRNTTTIATASISMLLNTWYYIEISATIADAGGTCIVKVNGTTAISFTGDTRNGGTVAAIDTIQINHASSNTAALIDDLYICDGTGSAPYNTFLGDVRINTLVPSGAGTDTQFTPSSGANYTTVDELPYSATDYVSATATGTRDTYAMSDLSGSYSVLAVQNNIIAKKPDAGVTSIKSAIRSGGTVYYGSSSTLGASDATVRDLRTTDPATSSAWTMAGVNNLEAGMEIV